MATPALPTVRRVIDPHSGVPAHRQLAASLRARIAAGEFPPGTLLPPAPRLRHEYAVGRATVQVALTVLRGEGLVDLDRGVGMRVREQAARERISVPRGAEIESVIPTAEDRAALGIPEGVSLMVVTVGGHLRGRYPGDRYVLVSR